MIFPEPATIVASPRIQAEAEAADLVGRWVGALRLGDQSIPIVIRVSQGQTGLEAVADSPSQGATDIPVTELSQTAGVVRFTLPTVNAWFEGTRTDDGLTWIGAWSQGSGSLPLVLTRAEAEAPAPATPPAPNRPQTPEPPFPYAAEEVVFPNVEAGIDLAGTLTTPPGEGPFPAVVLLTGSGAQDRDETLLGHKPFAVWADALTRRGVAVLRFDDRGVGGSGGGTADETSEDFAADAVAAVAWLRTRPGIDAARIGFLGHSEGGLIAPMAVSRGAPAAFVVMVAGQAVSGAEIVSEQATRLSLASGGTPEQVAVVRGIQEEVMAAIVRNKDDGAAAARDAEAILTTVGQSPAQAQAGAARLSTPWYRWFAAHDPATDLAALRVPVLAVYGARDLQVSADQNAQALARIQPEAEIVILPDLNHLMQTADTGLPAEYSTIEETIAPAALTTVTDWIVRVTGAPAPN